MKILWLNRIWLAGAVAAAALTGVPAAHAFKPRKVVILTPYPLPGSLEWCAPPAAAWPLPPQTVSRDHTTARPQTERPLSRPAGSPSELLLPPMQSAPGR